MRILGIQNCELEGFGRYGDLLRKLGIPFDLVRPDAGQPLPPWSAYDALLVGGTPISANDLARHAYLHAEYRYLEEAVRAKRPCLGICCGAQLLALAQGGAVHRCARMEIGCTRVRLSAAGAVDPPLDGFPASFPVFQWHGDRFDVPPGGELLVAGDQCNSQAFRCASVAGLLFHLEVPAAEVGAWERAYPEELTGVGKARGDAVAECRPHDAEMAALAERLLGNFLAALH
jgi:GMP synthase (glutamine-hydrolysing)